MNALIAAVFVALAVSCSAAPSGHGILLGAVSPYALSPIGPSGIVTGAGASGPSGVVTGYGAAGPSGIVTGAGPIGPTGPAGYGHAAVLSAPVVAAPALGLSAVGHGAWGLAGHGLHGLAHAW